MMTDWRRERFRHLVGSIGEVVAAETYKRPGLV
jgi:hypothetical protein